MVMERMQVLVTADHREWLTSEAARRGVPITAVVREALDLARGHRPAPARQDAYERFAALAGGPAVSLEIIDGALRSRYRHPPA